MTSAQLPIVQTDSPGSSQSDAGDQFAPSAAHPSPARRLSLALQGGGSHGAFTWGVLDALLEDARIELDGISGASAGAVNAVSLADGFAKATSKGGQASYAEGAASARESLRRVWKGVEDLGRIGSMAQGVARMVTGGWSSDPVGSAVLGDAMARWMSPYQSNPLDLNPLRRLLDQEIDFDAVARLDAPRVFVSATQVRTGRGEIFHGERLTLAAVMASACLPMLFQAVEIDGESYWDGGYAANPALAPLIDHCGTRDILLVQLTPLHRDDTPHTPNEIAERVAEITFNASLLSQMRNVDFIHRLLDQGALIEGPTYKRLRMHRVDGGSPLAALTQASKLSADPAMMEKLFDQGRAAAHRWLSKNFDQIGVQSTIDIQRDYVGKVHAPAARVAGGGG
jgi:NTE family protein